MPAFGSAQYSSSGAARRPAPYLEPAFLGGTVPCNSTYLPAYLGYIHACLIRWETRASGPGLGFRISSPSHEPAQALRWARLGGGRDVYRSSKANTIDLLACGRTYCTGIDIDALQRAEVVAVVGRDLGPHLIGKGLLEGDPEARMGIREDVMPSLMRSTNKYTVGRRSVARMYPYAFYSPLRVLIILSTSAGNIKDNDGQMFNFFIAFTNSSNPR
ncbi:hypothetical protein DFH09DRAFT_1071588 [Mycena vulgaris]|nr:hypothetical protein DFH09DRAFT_1071588 [Mycena vulgaris]